VAAPGAGSGSAHNDEKLLAVTGEIEAP
jgi:hypothetical protein